MDLYAYCGNNPVINVDSSVHFVFIILFVAAFVGLGVPFGLSALTQAAFNNGHVNSQ